MNTFIWSSCVVVGIAFGFLGGILFQQKFLAPPPIVYRVAPVIVNPASLTENCTEAARICYARKRSAKVVQQ